MIDSYDLAVLGAGPAGMEAAITATESGVKTVIIDQYPQSGGQYLMALPGQFKPHNDLSIGKEGTLFSKRINQIQFDKIYNSLVWGLFKEENESEWLVALYGKDSPKYIRSKNLVLANGAYDTPVAFPGWTLPGVITCGAALSLLKNQRIAPGSRVLISGTGPMLLSAAAHLNEAGVKVLCVCESNHILPQGFRYGTTIFNQPHRILEGLKYIRSIISGKTSYKVGWSIIEARGTGSVEEAIIAKVDNNGTALSGSEKVLSVDLIVSGYNLSPNTSLARMIGCKMTFISEKGGWVPVRDNSMQTNLPGVYAVGDGAGIGGAENSRLEGAIAGISIAAASGFLTTKKADTYIQNLKSDLNKQRQFGVLLGDLFTLKDGLISLADDNTILCRCEEITLGEVKKAVADGARSLGEVKMITRSGMGNCQGRMCEHSVAGAIIQALTNESMTREQVGYYSIRPPLNPIPISYLAESPLEERSIS